MSRYLWANIKIESRRRNPRSEGWKIIHSYVAQESHSNAWTCFHVDNGIIRNSNSDKTRIARFRLLPWGIERLIGNSQSSLMKITAISYTLTILWYELMILDSEEVVGKILREILRDFAFLPPQFCFRRRILFAHTECRSHLKLFCSRSRVIEQLKSKSRLQLGVFK